MNRGERAKGAKSKLAGLSEFQMAGNQHGFDVLEVHFPSIRLEVAGSIIGRQRAIGLKNDVRAVNLVPTRFEHGSR
jgi:hypothetical protein